MSEKSKMLNVKIKRKKREIIGNFLFKRLPSFLKEHSKECFVFLTLTTISGVGIYLLVVNNGVQSPFALRKRIVAYSTNSFIGKRFSKTVKNRFKKLHNFVCCANNPEARIQDPIGPEKTVGSQKILAIPVFIAGSVSMKHAVTYLFEGDKFSALMMGACVAYEAASASILARTGDVRGPASLMYFPIMSKLLVKKYRNIIKGDPVTFLELYGLPDFQTIKQFYGLK